MKQNLSYNEQKKVICETISLLGLENQSHEKKTQIINCLHFVVPRQKDAGFAALKDRLADWVINHYYELKTSAHAFFQYGNLKYLAPDLKDWLINLFKKVDEKIGDSIDYNDLYRSWLMKNPYFLYQQMSYMAPPYMMPPTYPTDRQGYQAYGIDPQQHYMQMAKCYSMNPMNPMYMPPPMPSMSGMSGMSGMPGMPGMGMPKYQPTQTPEMKSHPFYTYQMMHAPPPQNTAYQTQVQPPKQKIVNQSITKNKSNEGYGKQSKQMQAEDNSEGNKNKNKQKYPKQNHKNQPFFIIEPFMQKGAREQIPQRLVPLAKPAVVPVPENHDSSEILIVDQIGAQTNEATKLAKPKKSNQASNANAQTIANIMKSFEEEKNRKNLIEVSQKNLIPIGSQCRAQFQYCVCKGFALVDNFYECTDCNKRFHYACTQKKQNTASQLKKQLCHLCFMRNLDPLNRVVHEIKCHYVIDIKKNRIIQNIDFEVFDNYISKNSPYQIQIRCMRLEDASNLVPQYTWPDQCLVMLDEQRTIEFQALQHNSSLKKRKDMSVFLTNYIYFYNKNLAKRKNLTVGLEIKQNNVLELSQKKIRNHYTFLFGIYLIRKITPDQLSDQILKDPTNKVNFVQNFFSESTQEDEIQIQQIKVSLMDPYTWNLIDIPARGKRCIHGQCFDLKTFLSFMNVQKVRQWKCPVCNKQCRNFYVDTQQMQVIKEFRRKQSLGDNQKFSKQIEFHRDGRTLFVVQKQSDDEEEKNNNSSDCNKTKMIAKSA